MEVNAVLAEHAAGVPTGNCEIGARTPHHRRQQQVLHRVHSGGPGRRPRMVAFIILLEGNPRHLARGFQ